MTTTFQPTEGVDITAAAILHGRQPADDAIIFAHESNMYYYTATNNQPQCLANMSGHTSTIIAIFTYRNSPSEPHSILSVSRSGELIFWTTATSFRHTATVQYVPSFIDVSRLTNRPITCIDAHDSNTILLGCTSCIIICRRNSLNTNFTPTCIDIFSDMSGNIKRPADAADGNRLMLGVVTAVYLRSVQQHRENANSSQLSVPSASESISYGFYIAMLTAVYYIEVTLKTIQDTSSVQAREYRPQDSQQQSIQSGFSMSHHIIWRNENQPVIDTIYFTNSGNTEYIFFGRRNGNLTILSLDRIRQQYIPLYDGPLASSSISDFGSNPMLQSKSSIRFIQASARFDVLCIISADSTVLFINMKKLNECDKKISNLSLLIQSVVKHVGRYIAASFEQLHSDAEGPTLRLFTTTPTTDTSVSLC